jgi:signal transduction histidine kinase
MPVETALRHGYNAGETFGELGETSTSEKVLTTAEQNARTRNRATGVHLTVSTRRHSTRFAPGDRVDSDTIRRQTQAVLDTAFLRQLYDAVIEIVIILNRQRQIVFYNRALVEYLGLSDPNSLYGLRPGEALNCQHACESPGGCGTTEFCRTCGAIHAIISSQERKGDVKECRILQRDGGEALNLLVRTAPLTLGTEQYTLFAVTDISDEKRRQAFELVFFHDLMNSATGLEIFTKLLGTARPEQIAEIKDRMHQGVSLLLEQIRSQRDLTAAENRELAVRRIKITSKTLLRNVIESWRPRETIRAHPVVLDPQSHNVTFTSDPTMLSRVLTNMLKNAVEASPDDGTVTVGCRKADEGVEFWVHNTGVMPPDVQTQVFQRFYSTKGEGRGLGTYSMKLLGERCLKARVSFTSRPGEGTIFSICCPLKG